MSLSLFSILHIQDKSRWVILQTIFNEHMDHLEHVPGLIGGRRMARVSDQYIDQVSCRFIIPSHHIPNTQLSALRLPIHACPTPMQITEYVFGEGMRANYIKLSVVKQNWVMLQYFFLSMDGAVDKKSGRNLWLTWYEQTAYRPLHTCILLRISSWTRKSAYESSPKLSRV